MSTVILFLCILSVLNKINQAQYACSSFTDSISCAQESSCTWITSSSSCRCGSEVKLDILFGVDTSGSIGYAGFQIQKEFILGLVQQGINDGSRIGFYMFNTFVNKSRNLQYWDQTDLVNYVNGMYWSGGWTNTPQLLSDGLVEFAATFQSDRQQIFMIITDGNPCLPQSQGGCPQSACQYKTQVFQAGIRVVVIGVGDGLNSKYIQCLTQSDDDWIPVAEYSAAAFESITGTLSAVLCPVEIELKVTEVKAVKKISTSDSRLTRFVEIYNFGIDFQLNEIEITGLITMIGGTAPNITITQSKYVVFYDASDEPLGLSTVGSTPTCHLCDWDPSNDDLPCDLSGCAAAGSDTYTGYCFCNNAVYIACSNTNDGVTNCNNNIAITGAENACSICAFNDGYSNSDWDITISNAISGSVIDEVIHNAPGTGSWIVPVDGFSLELAWKGFDNDYGTSWIQSCSIFGTPGSDPVASCEETCWSLGSDCGGGNNYCDPVTRDCVCDTDNGYYPQCLYDDVGCLTCALLPEIDDCNVYFRKNGTKRYAYFNWTYIPLANEVFVLSYFDGSIDCGVDQQGYPIIGGGYDAECDVTTLNPVELYNPFYRLDNYYALNTTFGGYIQTKVSLTNLGDYYSVKRWCDVVTLSPSSAPTTMEPTLGPLAQGQTRSPTTAEPTTADPTTAHPTTSQPTQSPLQPGVTRSPTTSRPTTSQPTTSNPTTSAPTTPEPTRNPLGVGETHQPSSAPTTPEPTTTSPTMTTTEVETTIDDTSTTDIETTMDETGSETSMSFTTQLTTDVITVESSLVSTTEEFEDEECPGLDLAIILFYFFKYDQIQRKCDICLYETRGRRQQRRCEKIAGFIEGIADDYSKCMLNVCDYDCTVGQLQLNPNFAADSDEDCGCNIFECGPQAATAYRYNNGLIITFMIAAVAIFG